MEPDNFAEDAGDAASDNNSNIVDIGEPRLWKSYWEEDEDDVIDFTEEEVKNDPAKRILWAAENNHLEIVSELLTSDPGLVHSKDTDLYTPLHRASYNNHEEMAKLLLSNGADVASKTADGWQPLHSASRWNSVETAQVLINCGADVNARTNGGLTPLHMAASEPENEQMLELLLTDPCIDTNIRSRAGETAKDICQRCSPHYKLFDLLEDNVTELNEEL
ncbi:unnamed protein product [Candidula unifasciata]|uniref:Ankyrin repeat domain-containing protein 49 n=1 Tax=Candidula unifasciata TaxID=100452 RepID=A0A8S4A801_9EUPU|nr:unnamed protein product [Candidula unifasciata]